MTFKDQLPIDAVNSFLNGDEFAEDIGYTPYGSSKRVIKAIVERRRLTLAGEDFGRVLADTVEILIARHDTLGVTVINKGMNADEVILPEVLGGADVTFFVADILAQDEGLWHLLLQK